MNIKEALITLAAISLIVFAVLVLFQINDFTKAPVQTASATTDYFQLSCSQLKTQINSDLNDYYSGNLKDSRSNGAQAGAAANALLQIWHYKGCQP